MFLPVGVDFPFVTVVLIILVCQVDDFDGLLRNLPNVPAKKRGKRCTQLLTSGLTGVEKAELSVQRAQERLQREQVKAAQPKPKRVTMTADEAALWEQFKAAQDVNQLGADLQNVQLDNVEVSAAQHI